MRHDKVSSIHPSIHPSIHSHPAHHPVQEPPLTLPLSLQHGVFHHEGWRGPCGLNEVTCHVSGYGEGGLLTLDWKHFPYEG